MTRPSAPALAAIRAWYRLDRAIAAADRWLRATHRVTGEQAAILRIVAERDDWPMSLLRSRLSMHPATLGQAIARLENRGLARCEPDEDDARRRRVSATPAGRDLLASIPVIGPVRLRSTDADPADLRRIAEGAESALELFGLSEWADESRPDDQIDEWADESRPDDQIERNNSERERE